MTKLTKLLLLLAVAAFATAAFAQYTETVLYNFTGGADGATPYYLIMDSAGNLYGVAVGGGNTACNGGCGTVFKLSRSTGHWVETTLYTFTGGNDGANPSGITMDAAGNLYGFAQTYGSFSCGPGTAFKLKKPSGGGWTFSVIYKFGATSSDGSCPTGAPLLDSAGNIYGATEYGGVKATGCSNYGCGTVFKLTATTGYGLWPETILYTFAGDPDAQNPVEGVIADSAGNLYGLTVSGGSTPNCEFGCGTVYEVSPTSGGGWSESVIHSFQNYPTDGSGPVGGLTMDVSGNLYGTTYGGGSFTNQGCYGACGAVFEVSPVSGGGWTEKLIHSFNYTTEGALPSVGVVLNSTGHVFGLTGDDPNTLAGTAYELSSDAAGQWKIAILYTLGSQAGDGENPAGGSPLLTSAGSLIGTTRYGGAYGGGNIFKLTPAAAAK
jgi:uncharacterized repeat protein (TIGR03803 family)